MRDTASDPASDPVADPAAPASPSRTPGIVNLAAVTVIVAIVGAVALTSRQTPPPTIAEFAPQAIEQIEEALTQDAPAAQEGSTPGSTAPDPEATGDPGAGPSDQATEPGEVIERARVRSCVGDPPRQTEDPQSPPCVPFFDGDNGGATWQGVTADEIRIAWPNLNFFLPEDPVLMQLLVDHFNRRYEFYGRKIVLAEYPSTAFAEPNPSAMTADAVLVDEELQAFATIGYGVRDGAEYHYYDELARRGVVSAFAGLSALGTEQRFASTHPYQWSNGASLDTMFNLGADFICTTLQGTPPQAGTFAIPPATRSFGVIAVRSADGTIPPMALLTDQLAACGAGPTLSLEDDASNLQATNVMLQMQDAGVTTVLCMCGNLNHLRTNYFEAATNQGYFPEWLVLGYANQDLDNSFTAGNANPLQARNVFGITLHDRLLPRQQMPWYWALREGDPAFDRVGSIYYSLLGRYSHLLQVASGIQLAGPNLTPDTFAAGLQRATFPNPGAGGPPQYQAAFDYHTRHAARASAAMFWYAPEQAGAPDPSTPGTLCHLGGGTRYRVGQFPSEPQPFFQEPCIR